MARSLGAVLLCAGGLGAGAVARADVLEVNAGGYAWVAGGPAREQGAASVLTPEELAAAGMLDDTAVHPQSLTEAHDAAGPDRWREQVAAMAKKYDISPTLLEAVVWQESRWNERAVSPAGARGLAQLMPVTARELGVDANDPLANLEGGARYLRMQLDTFGSDIEKALAAYNAGPARVARAGGVPAIRETQLYVAAIMSRLAEPVRR
ncbi:transglycosylase [Novosphingobium sp. PC22D]|uniref:lytic transglycosylase domain-containing protein n=1 Tax=Novosphingobium sp. PC22D TaxID=1962403 RepID=UPI000BEF6D67|nr:lytic transglycosylase domain-containing protein [Novosphingobium sp. PC22D]PEQ10703.1 transglycosylase [Novosphingobium sp. PC22D]